MDGNDDKKIDAFCEKYWYHSTVRRYCIDRSIKRKDYDTALKILRESIVADREYLGLVREYSYRKKEIHHLLGDREAYFDELWMLATKYDVGNIEVFKELRSQYNEEEWPVKREEFLENLPKYVRKEVYYAEDKLYDRLLNAVVNTEGLSQLQKYTNVLKDQYPSEILEKYRNEIERMAVHSNSRKKYRELTAILHLMQTIDGGMDVVTEIIEDWRIRYVRRRAMMEELTELE